jgi:mono/diheme cytochrome c family protein
MDKLLWAWKAPEIARVLPEPRTHSALWYSMKAAPRFLSCLPFVVLLALGCSDDANDGGGLVGTGGSTGTAGSVGTAGSGGPTIAGTGPSMAGSTSGAGGTSTGGTSTGGTSSGTSGAGIGGLSQGGAGQAGAGQGGGATVPTDGKGLYEVNCMVCHLEQGKGNPVLGPEIVHPVREYANWVVRNGRALMAPWPKAMEKFGTDKLSDAQLTLIWDYLDQPPQPTTGAALFGDYCANCHGADGKGGPTTRPLAGEGKEVLKLVREGHNIGKYAMRHDSMPKFETMRITDPELNLILAHVNTF